MNKPLFALLTLIVAMTALIAASALYAGNTFEDVIKLEEKSYPHTKGIVEFSHAKHVDEYKAACGECHHDENGKARTDLKKGDAVEKCIECHKKPGEIKGKDAKGLDAKQKREYHVNALHDNCRDCHKAHNKKNKTKAAPVTCTGCHPKTK